LYPGFVISSYHITVATYVVLKSFVFECIAKFSPQPFLSSLGACYIVLDFAIDSAHFYADSAASASNYMSQVP
jgi:hypothetical protein